MYHFRFLEWLFICIVALNSEYKKLEDSKLNSFDPMLYKEICMIDPEMRYLQIA